MSITATAITTSQLRNADNTAVYRFSTVDVPAGTVSSEIVLALDVSAGRIKYFRISSTSTEYDISLRTKLEAGADTIDEILDVIEINKTYQADQDILFVNTDTVIRNRLYLVINNTANEDASNILIEIAIDEM